MEYDDSLVTIMTFDSWMASHILRGKLESYDIPSFICDEYYISLWPLYSNALGGIKLKINSCYLKKAQYVLREIEETKVTDDKGQIVTCTRCQSDSLSGPFTSMKDLTGLGSLLIAFWIGCYPLYYSIVYKCNSCNKEFQRP